QGKTDSENVQFEYVLLDKNLNEVTNGTFEEKDIRGAYIKFSDCTLMGDEILLSKLVMIKYIRMLSFNRIISLKDKTVSEPFYFENDRFKELDLFSADLIHEKFKENEYYTTAVPISYQNTQGFFVVEDFKRKQNF